MLDNLIFWKPKIKPAPAIDFIRAKRICRFLVIDDEELALPIEELKRDGYNISQITEVDSTYMSLCENATYDVILLDYNGVASPQIAQNDGFGVFERIRSHNPSQYIIAISGKAFDIAKASYLKEANDWLKKPVNLADTKDKLDRAIKARFDQSLLFDEIRKKLMAGGVPQKSIDRFIAEISETKQEKLSDYLKKGANLVKDVGAIAGLITQLIKAAHLSP